MPNSQHDLPIGPHILREFLSKALPDSQLEEVSTDEHYQPILLLQSSNVIAGFGFSNGNITKSYQVLYGSFKKQYTEHRTEWDALDLAFVFCVPPKLPSLDRFCSQVETDVYFCRKFIIPLEPPVADALARLPFLPLAPVRGRSLRPPSAQTFLQQCGTTAVLAKYLVVQGQRSPETIVEDCLHGTFGEPKSILSPASELTPVETRGVAPVRLERITIQNFRAYKKAQTFVLGDNVTILYGPNGFGKTSVFDAIDFAATGEIGRLDISNNDRFKKAATHLDSSAEHSSVSLFFAVDGVEHKIVRRVSDRKHALLDGMRRERKDILAELTGGIGPAKDRVENLVKLFRATHLFSQEHQELAKDFEKDCELSQEVVSRMLAFEDYSNAWKKVLRVCNLINTNIDSDAREIERLREYIEEEEEQLERLARTSQQYIGASELDEAIHSLSRRVSDAGVDVPSDRPDLATLRAWRATFETRIAEIESKKVHLSRLVKDTIELQSVATELAAIRSQIAKKEEELASSIAGNKACKEQLRIAEHKFTEASHTRIVLQGQLESLEWLQGIAPTYRALLEKQQLAAEQIDKSRESLELARKEERRTIESLNRCENDKINASNKLIFTRKQVETLNSMIEATQKWQAQRSRLDQIADEEQLALQALQELHTQDQEKLALHEKIKEEEADLLGQINEIEESESELGQLLSLVQNYVRSGVCPLCGEDHGSVEALLNRIEEQLSTDAASDTRIALSKVRDNLKVVSANRASILIRQNTAARALEALQSERGRLVQDIAAFEEEADKFGVRTQTLQTAPMHEFEEQRDGLKQQIMELEHEASIKIKEAHAANRSVEEAKLIVTAKHEEVGMQRRLFNETQKNIEQLREDPRIGQENIDLSTTDIEQRTQLISKELKRVEALRTKADGVLAQQKKSHSSVVQELASIQNELLSLRVKAADVQTLGEELVERLKGAELPEHINEDRLTGLISQMANEQARNSELRDAVASIELAVDAATTSAAFERLHKNINSRKEAMNLAQRSKERHEPWLKYFEGVSKLISSEQTTAVSDFTSEYGPRTSVIQRRLRSVYGFDKIEILSEKSKIRVRVKRQGKDLHPTDFFSQSQQQTLLLGLFLTACLSQTWSALSPVFLDDPVTHFDDLNTYAFLDLIIGLFDSEPGQRQFVISTCDEKFLQLALQKFRHLGPRAKFYTFAAIDQDGPVVHEGVRP